MPKVKFVRIFNPSPRTVVFASEEQIGCRNGWIALRFVLWSYAYLLQYHANGSERIVRKKKNERALNMMEWWCKETSD